MALTKILNDENKSFQPVLTDKLVYDTKPTVNSFNGITSDAVARAIAGASGEVPAVTESDNGKVLTAVYDEGGPAVEWADAQGGGGAEYSAGTGISISAQDEISVDTTVIATKNDLSGYQPTISDLETIRSGAAAGATAMQPSQLASVATSGSYNDLTNKPTIPAAQVNSDWNASSGVAQILNKPSIPTVADNVYRAVYGTSTYAQVVAAFNAGKAIALVNGDSDDGVLASDVTFNDEGGEIIFARHNVYGSAGSRVEYTLTSGNNWSSTTKTVPSVTVDQTYNSASTNAQSGTAVAGALATINQVPASTSADEDKVLTVNSSGNAVWATAQGGGGGSSYTFSAPLRESSGTVVLDVDTDELNIAQKTTPLTAQRSISAAESGYAWYLGTLTQDTSETVYTFTFNNVTVSSAVAVAVNAQGKHIYPLFVGETYGSWGNQWIIPTALTFNASNNTVSGSFDVCFKSGESDYPTHLDSYGQLSWASVLVFVVASDVPAAQVSSSSIYGSTTSGSTVSYSTGTESILMVKHPVPAVNLADNGKVLKATYSNGVGSFGWDTAPAELPSVTGNAGKVLAVNSGATGVEWINNPTELPSVTGNAGKVLTVNSGATGTEWTNFTQIEVVASMPANPTSGVLYIVTGA